MLLCAGQNLIVGEHLQHAGGRTPGNQAGVAEEIQFVVAPAAWCPWLLAQLTRSCLLSLLAAASLANAFAKEGIEELAIEELAGSAGLAGASTSRSASCR